MKPLTQAVLLTLAALPGAASAAVYSFSGAGLAITDASAANPYPATIEVAGIPLNEPLLNIVIKINGITHSYIDDVAAIVGSPGGLYVTLFDGAGVEGGVVDQVWVFDDTAEAEIPTTTSDPSSGRWRPNDQYGSEFPDPVPAGTHPVTLSTFKNDDPNGTWKIFIADFTAGDGGTLGGWSIEFYTVPEPGTASLAAGLSAGALLRRRRSR